MTLADPSVGMTVLPGGDASIVAQRAESDECFRKIESWLQKCLTEHQHCTTRAVEKVTPHGCAGMVLPGPRHSIAATTA